MIYLKFIRTTHDNNGRCRSFSPEAWQFWWEHGAIVGEALRPKTPLTLAEIVTASREYALEGQESGLSQILDEERIAWCLIKLLQYDMVGIVFETMPTANVIH